MKNMWKFILLCAVPILCATNSIYGQSESEKFDFFLKANIGSLFNKNASETPFKPQPTASFGSHLMVKYSFSRLGVSTGIGLERLKFAQILHFPHDPNEHESSTVSFSYFAWSIPILAHYSFTDRFEIYGGMNLLAASWDNYGIRSESNRTSTLEVRADEDIPNWQFTQEIMAGLNYKLSDRFVLGVNAAKSLKNIEGMGVDLKLSVPDRADFHVAEKFNYSWTRVNLELIYKFNK